MPLPPLGQLFSLFFFVLSVCAQLSTLTIGQNDSSVRYSAGWRTAIHDGQPFRLVDILEADVQIALPRYKRSKGAMYYACLDCGLETNGSMLTVDAHDPTENGTQPPTNSNTSPTSSFSATSSSPSIFDSPPNKLSASPSNKSATLETTPTITSAAAASPSPSGVGGGEGSSESAGGANTVVQTGTTGAKSSSEKSAIPVATTGTEGTTSSSGGSAISVAPTGTATAISTSGGSTVTVAPTGTTSVISPGAPTSGGSPEPFSATSSAPPSQGTVSTTASRRPRVPASVIAVVVVVSVAAALSCALGIFILLKIRRLRLSQRGGAQGPPVLPAMSIPSLHFPSFRTQHQSYISAGSASTESLYPSDSASYGPYQRERSTAYLNVRAVSPALVSPALPSSTMDSWEDVEIQRPRNPFEAEISSISSDDTTEFMAQRTSNP
ncbi:hypothetical protein HWV62_19819, partial [Athelia sp. TMB]